MANQHTKKAAATRKKAPTHRARASMAVTAATPINTTDLGASLVALFRQHGIAVHDVEFSEPVRITTNQKDQAATSPSVQSEPEVPAGIDRIEGALNHLHSVVELVEKRLSTVLRSDPPAAAGNGAVVGEAPVEQSHVGQRLRALESRIWQAGVVLHSINRRLEV